MINRKCPFCGKEFEQLVEHIVDDCIADFYDDRPVEDELRVEIKDLIKEVRIGIDLHTEAMKKLLATHAELRSAKIYFEQIRDCAPANMYRDGKLLGVRSQMIAAEAIKHMDREKK